MKKNLTFRDAVSSKLTEEEAESMKASQDIIGSIAIIEIPEELEEKGETLAKTLLEVKPYVKSVFKKGKHEGEFRTQELKFLAGENTKETIHKENNVRLRLDIEKVYFSPRLSEERKRIASLIKKGEEVLVMFNGCAPFQCVIAKNSEAKETTGVEINHVAHEYAQENLKLNKIKNSKVLQGDVAEIVPSLGKFDRIVMPAPHNAMEYFTLAMDHVKPEGMIHLYTFAKEDEEFCFKNCEILKITRCGQVKPGEFRVCIDLKVNKA